MINNNNNNSIKEYNDLTNISWITLNKKGLINEPNIRLNNQATIYIYQLIEDNRKIYIGSTFNLAQRFWQHRYRISKNNKSCPIFYNYVTKYGW
jgi:hypothetical protein